MIRQFRRAALIYNPIAGAGKAEKISRHIAKQLMPEGFAIESRQSAACYDAEEMAEFLAAQDAVIVAGGDGTLRGLLPCLVRAAKPVYVLPFGNESLFSREHHMKRSVRAVANVLCRGEVVQAYVASVNGALFHTMVSIGLDSEVIADIADRRTAAIGRSGYVLPILRAMRHHRPPAVCLAVDGKPVIAGEPGLLIVAKNRQYALRLGLVPEADSSCEDLWARFFPYSTLLDLCLWGIRSWAEDFSKHRSVPVYRGRKFEIRVAENDYYPVQADGEFAGVAPVIIEAEGKSINVLCSPKRQQVTRRL